MVKIINTFLFLLIVVFSLLINGNYFTLNKEVTLSEKEEIKEEVIYEKEVLNPNFSYLIIDKLRIKNIILEGTSDDVLNNNVIGIHKASANLDSVGNIILAGHNNKYVFGNLKNIKINDEIILMSKEVCYRFKVISKNIYSINDYSYFKYTNDKKLLTLITCHSNSNYRLVVVAEEIKKAN